MHITPELLKRFFENKCTPIEVEGILMYFINNKEALDKYLSKSEWDEISIEGQLDRHISESILNKLNEFLKPTPTEKIGLRKYSKIGLAAAASIILILLTWSISLLVMGEREYAKNLVSTNLKKVPAIAEKHSIVWKTFQNTDRKPRELLLPDGSVVIVYKNSHIKYPTVFEGNKREIYMKGDAFFEVSKNKEKPFTVYSGVLSTTALGTSFRVTVFDKLEKNIRVQLFTGKVIVKPSASALKGQKDIFLTPGEQVMYSGIQKTPILTVSRMNYPMDEFIGAKDVNQKMSTINNEVICQHTPLTEVFDALTGLYNVKISFNKEELGKLNFTGSINKKDPIINILKAITTMNGLELKESSDGFDIIKIK
jgi:ferric-dicitrate binding protein FerR (iron transport regulator)